MRRKFVLLLAAASFVVMAVATPVASADYGISVGSGSSG
jgi:hypothetical protein